MLSEKRVEQIFGEMDSYILDLIPDPTSLGPQYFRDSIAICRNHLNRVGLVLSEVDRERLGVSSELRKQEATFALEYDDCLANNAQVRALSSIDDRRATVNSLLRAERIQINELRDQQHVLDSVHKLVLFRNRELQATMTALKDQNRVMQGEIRSGSFYGDERAANGLPDADDITAEELAQMISTDSDKLPETADMSGVDAD
jgi:hypothetical protein